MRHEIGLNARSKQLIRSVAAVIAVKVFEDEILGFIPDASSPSPLSLTFLSDAHFSQICKDTLNTLSNVG